MSTATDAAKRAIEVIGRTSGQTARSSALTDLIKGVEDFVEKAEADKELANRLSELKNEQKNLEIRIGNEEDKQQKRGLDRELDEVKSIISSADQARREVGKNKAIISALEGPAEQLLRAIRNARN